MKENELFAICPLDGRYKSRIRILEETFLKRQYLQSKSRNLVQETLPRIIWKSNSLDEKLEKQLDSWISSSPSMMSRKLNQLKRKLTMM